MRIKIKPPYDNKKYDSVPVVVGIDNGVSGAITILALDGTIVYHAKTPVKRCLSYTKAKQWVNRIDVEKLKARLSLSGIRQCLVERPMINPMRFKASVSAIRCLEATQIILEQLRIPYEMLDSKSWQKELLPSGLHKEELKSAALDVARRLFPKLEIVNADSVLIAEYCRRKKR